MIIFQSIVKDLDIEINKNIFYPVTNKDKQEGVPLLRYNNAIGVRMKKSVGSLDSSFWTDDSYKYNIPKFDEDWEVIKTISKRGGIVVFSPSIIGEDLSKMKIISPKTEKYISTQLESLQNVRK